MRRPHRAIVAVAAAGAIALTGLIAPPAIAAEAPAELLLSEVVEGSSNNKAVEIFNPTGSPVDLSGYSIRMYFNGSSASTLSVPLAGTVAASEAFVLVNGSASDALKAFGDQITSGNWFNGDDVIALFKGDTAVDVFGQIGVDPGAEWGSGVTGAADASLRRHANVCVGDTDGANPFNPADQWDGFPIDTFADLGTHAVDCGGEEEPPPTAGCDLENVTIGSVQGTGAASPRAGETVLIEGTVVGDFQAGGFNGYFVQDAGDGDPATSDGVFVYAPGGDAVAVGDVVSVVGDVTEFDGLTEIAAVDIEVCATGADLPAPTEFSLPASPEQREALEGMYVTLPQSLAILEYFEYGRYGTIDVGLTRQSTPTATYLPTDPRAAALAASNLAERITIDDGRSSQNPDPAIHPNGEEFTLTNTFRGGDLVTDVTGVLDERFGGYVIQPTQGATFEAANPRPEVPDVGGNLTVSSFNVLNYFTTLDDPNTNADNDIARGANTVEEFERQEAKIVAALAEIDADVFGLIEIENNADSEALATLTAALNDHLGSDVYDYIATGKIGTDVITTALMYKPSEVTPVGDFALMNQAKDPRWLDNRNRPGLTQTFEDANGEAFTVVVNHLKSKGSACTGEAADPLQGECNIVRTNAANALADWLATDPTGQGTVGRELIIGDLNAYDKEDPIQALIAKGYTDLILEHEGEDAYSYVFDGQNGYLDHALAGPDLAAEVTGASPWNINADEPSLIDYDMSFKHPAQDALFAPDLYRSSDHDPIVVGLELTPVDTIAPTIEAVAVPSFILVPNNKERTIRVHIDAEDDRGDVTVELTDVAVNGKPKAKVTQVDDRTFTVTAVNGAVYTFTYTATDAAGNTATDKAYVIVGVKGLLGLL